MFQQLVLPLKQNRRHRVVVDFAEETGTEYRKQAYEFEGVDIIVLEGIYLLKRAHRAHFDLTFWVDCTFEAALERALQRGQEGLPAAETVRAYETIYFPAQRIHFAKDNPRAAADLILKNDPRLDCCESPAIRTNPAKRESQQEPLLRRESDDTGSHTTQAGTAEHHDMRRCEKCDL